MQRAGRVGAGLSEEARLVSVCGKLWCLWVHHRRPLCPHGKAGTGEVLWACSAQPSAHSRLLPLELLEVKICPVHLFQHAMVIDSRNSSILPRRGALLKVNQVVFSPEPLVGQPVMCGTGLSHTVLGLVSTGSSIECLKSRAVSCPEGTGGLGDTLEAKVIQLVSSCCSWCRQDPGCPVYIFRAAPSGEVCR